MESLQQFNPKLATQLQEDPSALLDLIHIVEEHEASADAAAATEAIAAAAE
jgi:hypothetical protein